MQLWEIFVAVVLGIVEGLTEFAPVSSTGHMILVKNIFLNYHEPKGEVFLVVIQLGSMLAVTVVYWRRLLSLIGIEVGEKNREEQSQIQAHMHAQAVPNQDLIFQQSHTTLSRREKHKKNKLSIIHILIGMAPAVIVGLLFYDEIKKFMGTTKFVILAIVAGGILMILAEKFKPAPKANSLDEVTYKQAFMVGLFQCLALWSGFSRSGSMISGGLIAGISHRTAADFAFILGLPMMVAASGKDLLESWHILHASDLPFFITGFVTAFIVSIISIKFFLALLKRINLTPFAIYRFILAGVILLIAWAFNIPL
ncbi:undecaprenyl-diphosphate phosphatase [Thermoflavimicrobium dichotomicum]|uniref:Undecaprenyl-diphosphatase n=1 Tax=Thermoflavimicrobium dichotomicum TaxID=46223 RepID=A0A1I3MYD2_9BACL|nr:undecaprenyl-diphosphate phosphatase [Thermoflavimicrobium dichotomicum]SFJ01666.1 undecaprenyl-diphosphatase [Thermoflavimicrobium dichotomicum]